LLWSRRLTAIDQPVHCRIEEGAVQQNEAFYSAALTAGAIVSGFIGTFLTFRIQREANYYRQPVLDFNTEKARDVSVGRSRFPVSLVLLLLGAMCSVGFGLLLPLAALAEPARFSVSAPLIVSGLIASVVLVAGYFFAEVYHYRMLRIDWDEWRRELWILLCSILLAALAALATHWNLKG
jgi:hypothetical protein